MFHRKLHLVNSTKKEKSWESKEIEFSSHIHFFVTKIKMTWSEHTVVGVCIWQIYLLWHLVVPCEIHQRANTAQKNRECYGTMTSPDNNFFCLLSFFSLMKWRGVNGMGWWKLYRNNHRYLWFRRCESKQCSVPKILILKIWWVCCIDQECFLKPSPKNLW